MILSRDLDKRADGYALDMHFLEAGRQSVLTYSTIYGDIVGWDLRSNSIAWTLHNGVRKGQFIIYFKGI